MKTYLFFFVKFLKRTNKKYLQNGSKYFKYFCKRLNIILIPLKHIIRRDAGKISPRSLWPLMTSVCKFITNGK